MSDTVTKKGVNKTPPPAPTSEAIQPAEKPINKLLKKLGCNLQVTVLVLFQSEVESARNFLFTPNKRLVLTLRPWKIVFFCALLKNKCCIGKGLKQAWQKNIAAIENKLTWNSLINATKTEYQHAIYRKIFFIPQVRHNHLLSIQFFCLFYNILQQIICSKNQQERVFILLSSDKHHWMENNFYNLENNAKC